MRTTAQYSHVPCRCHRRQGGQPWRPHLCTTSHCCPARMWWTRRHSVDGAGRPATTAADPAPGVRRPPPATPTRRTPLRITSPEAPAAAPPPPRRCPDSAGQREAGFDVKQGSRRRSPFGRAVLQGLSGALPRIDRRKGQRDFQARRRAACSRWRCRPVWGSPRPGHHRVPKTSAPTRLRGPSLVFRCAGAGASRFPSQFP